MSGIPFDNNGVHFRDFIDLLWHLEFFQRAGNELLELVITVAWSMWFNRNAVRQGKAQQPAATVLQKARLLLEEFQLANFQPSRTVMHDKEQWTNPSSPWYKLNVDGEIFANQHASSVGVIIRDQGGLVAAALSKKVFCPLGPLEAEAKALEEVVDFTWDVGIRDVHFECDSKHPFITSLQALVKRYRHSGLSSFHMLSEQGTSQLTSWLNMPKILAIM